jgi:hypothetical protein
MIVEYAGTGMHAPNDRLMIASPRCDSTEDQTSDEERDYGTGRTASSLRDGACLCPRSCAHPCGMSSDGSSSFLLITNAFLVNNNLKNNILIHV